VRHRSGALSLALAGAWVLFLTLPVLRHPFAPGLKGDSGAALTLLARNLVRFGPVSTAFLPVASRSESGDLQASVQHPPLVVYLVALGFALFGESEAVARAVPVLGSLATLAFLLLLGGRLAGLRAAALAVLLCAAFPVTGLFADDVEYQGNWAPAFVLAAFLCYDRWREAPSAPRLLLLLLATACGGLTDWPAFLTVPALTLHWYLHPPRRRAFLFYPASAAAAFLAQVSWFASAKTATGQGSALAYALFRASPDLGAFLGLARGWADGFTLPFLALAGVAGAALLSRRPRGETQRGSLLALLLWVGLAYPLLLPGLAAGHPFTCLYLAPPLALLGGALLARGLRRGRLLRSLTACGAAALLVHLGARTRTLRAPEDRPDESCRQVGHWLQQRLGPAEALAVTDRVPLPVLVYADRRVEAAILDEASLEEAAGRGATALVFRLVSLSRLRPLLRRLIEKHPFEAEEDFILIRLDRETASPIDLDRRLPDADPLEPPAGLAASQDGSRMVFSWEPSRRPDLAGYRLWFQSEEVRLTGRAPIGVLLGSEPRLVFDFLHPDRYRFWIAMRLTDHRESPPSPPVRFEVRPALGDLLRRRLPLPVGTALLVFGLLPWALARAIRPSGAGRPDRPQGPASRPRPDRSGPVPPGVSRGDSGT